jgi:DNA topoisomerase-3
MKQWKPVQLRPEGLYGTKPATGGNKASKLKAIKEALHSARRVWLATDCDREGQLIGQEILEHFGFRGEVMRVMFTAQDPQAIRDAFASAKPNAHYKNLYAAAVARSNRIRSTISHPPAPQPSCSTGASARSSASAA